MLLPTKSSIFVPEDSLTLNWIDIGVNLTNKRFDKDREQVILDAAQVGVVQQIITGTNLVESKLAISLCKQYEGRLFSTAGCHPHDAKNFTKDDLEDLTQLIHKPSVVAVGECGLDFNRNFSPPDIQLSVFEQQLKLATNVQKPVFLHERDAFDPQVELISKYRDRLCDGVIHCFTGSKKQLTTYLDLGLHIGITGWICDERRGVELKEIVKYIPGDRLMLETDAPYLLPRNLKPKPKSSRNLPQYLPHIAVNVAQARNVSLESLSETCLRNTREFFKL